MDYNGNETHETIEMTCCDLHEWTWFVNLLEHKYFVKLHF